MATTTKPLRSKDFLEEDWRVKLTMEISIRPDHYAWFSRVLFNDPHVGSGRLPTMRGWSAGEPVEFQWIEDPDERIAYRCRINVHDLLDFVEKCFKTLPLDHEDVPRFKRWYEDPVMLAERDDNLMLDWIVQWWLNREKNAEVN